MAAEEKKVKSMGFTGQERVGHDGVSMIRVSRAKTFEF